MPTGQWWKASGWEPQTQSSLKTDGPLWAGGQNGVRESQWHRSFLWGRSTGIVKWNRQNNNKRKEKTKKKDVKLRRKSKQQKQTNSRTDVIPLLSKERKAKHKREERKSSAETVMHAPWRYESKQLLFFYFVGCHSVVNVIRKNMPTCRFWCSLSPLVSVADQLITLHSVQTDEASPDAHI